MNPQVCFLIDDDDDDRDIFHLALDEVDTVVNFESAKNGKAALQRLSDTSFVPKIIFLDVNMPLMTGEECLQEIRKLEHLNVVPVYMYTTSADDYSKARFVTNGATSTVTKPATISELVILIKDLLK